MFLFKANKALYQQITLVINEPKRALVVAQETLFNLGFSEVTWKIDKMQGNTWSYYYNQQVW